MSIVLLVVIMLFALLGGKYIVMLLMLLPLRYWTVREMARSKIKEELMTVRESGNQLSKEEK